MTSRETNDLNRRQWLQRAGMGFGSLALASMGAPALAASLANGTGRNGGATAVPKAKSVIFLYLNGGVSQVDTFDPKPELDRMDGKPLPGGVLETETPTGVLMRSPFRFRKHGDCGLEVSEVFPRIGEQADKLCVIRSMHTDIPNHEPAMFMLNSGHFNSGRPAMGAWVLYGLGRLSQNLPGFVVLCPEPVQYTGPVHWTSGFLPARHQGTYVSTGVGANVEDFDPAQLLKYLGQESPSALRPIDLEFLGDLERLRAGQGDDPVSDPDLANMELAFRMQSEAPGAFDLRQEDESTREAYGDGHMARSCLLARRLVERGVRMVQVYFGQNKDWDDHSNILNHRRHGRDCDQAIAALLQDLQRRGLLEETLVVCATEFGRTPAVEIGGGDANGRLKRGRDHNHHGFTVWLAGAGVKAGHVHGATDEFGFKAVEDRVHVHDLQATILHLLGLDHEQLTYRYSGRDFRLTDVGGRVVRGILA